VAARARAADGLAQEAWLVAEHGGGADRDFGREFEVDPGYPLRHPDPDRR